MAPREERRNDDPQMASALSELRAMIQGRYPEATFAVSHGEDPDGVYLTATVDIEDTDTIVDIVIDRLVAMQVEESLPIYFVPMRPSVQVGAMRRHTV